MGKKKVVILFFVLKLKNSILGNYFKDLYY